VDEVRERQLYEWLAGRGVHPNDAGRAILWAKEFEKTGFEARDGEIYKKSMEFYRESAGLPREVVAPNFEVVHRYELSWKQFVLAFAGAATGAFIWDLVRMLLR
jgi:hypothetical protein